MARLTTFMMISLEGYYADATGGIGWHDHGPEEMAFSEEQLAAGDTLLFGRKTFEGMASFWPSPDAAEAFPDLARGMTDASKVVVTRSGITTDWANTRVERGDAVAAVARMRNGAASNLTVLGSGNLVAQLADANLVDEYQLMVDPVLLGGGVKLFPESGPRRNLELLEARSLQSGVAILRYRPLDRTPS